MRFASSPPACHLVFLNPSAITNRLIKLLLGKYSREFTHNSYIDSRQLHERGFSRHWIRGLQRHVGMQQWFNKVKVIIKAVIN